MKNRFYIFDTIITNVKSMWHHQRLCMFSYSNKKKTKNNSNSVLDFSLMLIICNLYPSFGAERRKAHFMRIQLYIMLGLKH